VVVEQQFRSCGLRSAAQLISYEVRWASWSRCYLMSAACRSSRCRGEGGRVSYVFPGFIAFFIYLSCGVAETNRNPFDLPEAESELVAATTRSTRHEVRVYFLPSTQHDRICSMVTVMFLAAWLRLFPNWDSVLHCLPLLWLNFVPRFSGSSRRWVLPLLLIWFRGTFPRYSLRPAHEPGWKVFLPVSLAHVMRSRSACCSWGWAMSFWGFCDCRAVDLLQG